MFEEVSELLKREADAIQNIEETDLTAQQSLTGPPSIDLAIYTGSS